MMLIQLSFFILILCFLIQNVINIVFYGYIFVKHIITLLLMGTERVCRFVRPIMPEDGSR